MNILFLTSRLPYPPNRGDRVRTFNFLRRLSADHRIHLLSFIETEDERAHLPALETFCKPETVLLSRSRSYRNMLGGAASSLPFQTLYYKSGEMERRSREILREHPFDLIYTHLFRMAPYAGNAPGIPRIVDLTDCISRELAASIPHRPWFLRVPLRLEAAKMRKYEARVARSFDEVWTISEADRSEILKLAPGAPVHVVHNGVEESLYAARPTFQKSRLGFLGNLSVPHNVDAARFLAERILPRVRAECPETELELLGAAPAPAVRRLEGRNGISVTGSVDNLKSTLENFSVFVCPLRFAAGVQNKILEAMAAGLPVVTTSLGNQGLGAEPDREIFVRDDPEDFARAVISLLQDPERAASVGESGRTFVKRTFSWDAVAERVAAIRSSASSYQAVSA